VSVLTAAPAVTLCLAFATTQQSGELIERTLAIVGGQAITLSDVRAALSLGLIDDVAAGDAIGAATQRLIERLLVLREVQRYAPAEPAEAAIDARVATLSARFPTAEALRSALAAVAFSELQLRAWARDDLHIAAYLDQRFAAAGSPERRTELVRDWIADLRRRTAVVELKK
jgi:hypothetical protein